MINVHFPLTMIAHKYFLSFIFNMSFIDLTTR